MNGINIKTDSEDTILTAANNNHVYIPTLCYHPRVPEAGKCRLCLVEIVGSSKMVPACTTKMKEGMEIITSSKEIDQYVKENLQLVLSRHPNDCMRCEVNGNCELQDLIGRYDVSESWPKLVDNYEQHLDTSSKAVYRNLDKCVSCGRCERVCHEMQGMDILSFAGRGREAKLTPIEEKPLAETDCISCGQCTSFCPVGAIIEKPQIHEVLNHLRTKHLNGKLVVCHTAPATRVAIGEEFSMKPGTTSTGQLVSALKEAGFDYVFDTNFAADLTIMEEAAELHKRVKEGGPFPMFTSCCPGWINLLESTFPQLIPNVSSCKSPQGMFGAILKTYWAKKMGKKPEDIICVSIMPCVAKKGEAAREQLKDASDGLVPDNDYVLTTREIARLFKMNKIDFGSLPESPYDDPLGESTGAAAIFGVTGGVGEALLRTAFPNENITAYTAVRGLTGVKEASIDIGGGQKATACVVHGTKNLLAALKEVVNGNKNWTVIEMMACHGGCIGGGGQPKSLDPKILEKRTSAIYSIDEKSFKRRSHENKDILKLYENFLEHPGSHLSHKLLHTHYTPKYGDHHEHITHQSHESHDK